MKGYITFSVYVFMSALMAAAEPLPGTEPLGGRIWQARMVEIDRYLIRRRENRGQRAEMWENYFVRGGYQRVMPLLREELGRSQGWWIAGEC